MNLHYDANDYGYNGMEHDTGVTGGSYMTYFREYDARLGRFWGIDPVTHAWESPYAAMGGNPILAADPSGADTTQGEGPPSGCPCPEGEFYHDTKQDRTYLADGSKWWWLTSISITARREPGDVGYVDPTVSNIQSTKPTPSSISGTSPYFLGLDMQMLMQDYEDPSIQMPSLAYRADSWYTGALHDISTDRWVIVFFPQAAGFAKLLQIEYGVRDAINVVITSHIFDRGRHLNGNIVVGQEGVDAHVEVAGLIDGVFAGVVGSWMAADAQVVIRGSAVAEASGGKLPPIELPEVHSVYGDGLRVYSGQQPRRIIGPESDFPHTVLRWDEINGRVYQGREFEFRYPVRDIDFTNPTYPNGVTRPGHPGPPHQHLWNINDPIVGPTSGYRRGPPEPIH